ncbi:MAG: PDZ domain-containing protein [Verrucomicrobia bacterium]|nr:PDZ domain-containing protein [Verrucomicrobiota bacterium]
MTRSAAAVDDPEELVRVNFDFRRELARKVEGNLSNFCYQCGACVGDCPAAAYSREFNPREIMLKVLYGLGSELLKPDSILWHCTNCYNCHERCPQQVKPVEVIISLKNMLADRGIYPGGIDKIIKAVETTGRTTPASSAVDRQREQFGLPPIRPVNAAEIQKLLEPVAEGADEVSQTAESLVEPTPAPLPGGERTMATSNEAPLLGGVGSTAVELRMNSIPSRAGLALTRTRNLNLSREFGSKSKSTFKSKKRPVDLSSTAVGVAGGWTHGQGQGSPNRAPEATSAKNGLKDSKTNQPPSVTIDLEGLASRLHEVPVPAGNYGRLSVTAKHLLWTARDTGFDAKRHLKQLEITHKDPKPKTLVEDIASYELSADGKKLLLRKGDNFHVIASDAAAPAKLDDTRVNLDGWTFMLDPREEWRQIFTESWRMIRDFFYDRGLHGLNWFAILKKYLPLVDRVSDRSELSDLISEMAGELSALHIYVFFGDEREGPDQIRTASLGARLLRDESAGGWRVDHIFRADPDYPAALSPLARPGVEVQDDDVILRINGRSTLNAAHPEILLRNQAGKQVLLDVRPPKDGASRQVIVKPITAGAEANLRYDEWEYTRRLRVEELGKGQIGYVHLRAMGTDNIAEWAREFYPVFKRQGLIIDVRNNRGGNIDSWILGKLLRKAWFYWQPRVGSPYWNMQYAFRGHLVVLCNERTASDGEAFTEGFKRLGLGKVIGTRTWGGEIWLRVERWLVDSGAATAAEFGVYGPEGAWLIEGHGVDPDIVVDNLPHATFKGADAQLDAAVKHLQELIAKDPRPVPPAPKYPDKSFPR